MDTAELFQVLEELGDVLIAAQALEERYHANGRPYLQMRARQLQFQCHDGIDALERAVVAYEPVKVSA